MKRHLLLTVLAAVLAVAGVSAENRVVAENDTQPCDYLEIDITQGTAVQGNPTCAGGKISFSSAGSDIWGYDVSSVDASVYKYLVIVPKKAFTEFDGAPQFIYGLTDGTDINDMSDWGFAYGFYQQRRATVLNLTDKKVYEDNNEQIVIKDFSEKDINLQSLKRFYVKSDGVGDYEFSAIYFTNEKPIYDNRFNFVFADYLREATSKGTFGTICLPYAAAICGADAYEVAGVDNAQNPSKLYMKETVGVLKAGVPYVYVTNNDKKSDFNEGNVTFHKAGANTVAAPINNALCGSFNIEKTIVPEGSYILKANGHWGKGTGNTVGQYKAYLTLTDAMEIPNEEASAAKYIAMDIAGGTTAISEVKGGESADGAIYSLSGVRVDRPQKGLYIKNGKKIMVK